ncbi:MAG: hypothetical protein GQ539_11620 [Sulfitobacter sp.]|nr:hypothetical protein [Sulfitobacter sp.]
MSTYSEIEQETIVLLAVCQMIDDMVNHAMFIGSESLTDGNILFHSHIHQQLFNVHLVDFLSFPQLDRSLKERPFNLPPTDTNSKPSDRSYLYYLKTICKNPCFGNVPTPLSSSLTVLSDWLDGETSIKGAHFPSLDLSFNIRVNRLKAISMTGNIGKHNITRLSDIAKKLLKIFSDHGQEVSLDQCYSALPDFQELFHDHALNYQSSHIVEMLNNLRWGIHEYLLPEFDRSFESISDKDGQQYHSKFNIPDSFENEFSKGAYRLLMGLVRRRPVVQKFGVNASMKDRLS